MVIRANPEDYFSQGTQNPNLPIRADLQSDSQQPVIINQYPEQQLMMFYAFLAFVIIIAVVLTIIYLRREKTWG